MNKGMQYAYLTEKERHILQPLLCKFQTLAPNMFSASYFIHYFSIKVIYAASEFHSIYKWKQCVEYLISFDPSSTPKMLLGCLI